MKTKKTCSILFAGTDLGFTSVLHGFERGSSRRKAGLTVELTIRKSIQELQAKPLKRIDILIVQDMLIVNEMKIFSEVLIHKDKDCKFVILLSHKGGGRILELMNILRKTKGALPELYLLKDNHSPELMASFLEDVLEQVKKNNSKK